MNAREKSALEHNMIKLFMMPEEVCLVVSCLDWVQLELKIANDNLRKLNMSVAKHITDTIRSEYFTVLLPLIEETVKSIVANSAAHFYERGDKKGKEKLLEEIEEWEKRTCNLLELKEEVTMEYIEQSMPNNTK